MLPGVIDMDVQVEDNKCYRLGTLIEKNVSLTQEKMEAVEKQLREKVQIWSAYPDIWVEELLIPNGSSFHLLTYQRIMMRNLARVPLNHITGARGVSKTFITLLMFFHRCIFAPGSVLAFSAPGKAQAAQIAKQTVNDLLSRFPLLKLELSCDVLGGKDYFEVRFRNGSKIEITAALESARGHRYEGIGVDEARDQDGDSVNGILVPTVSKNRAMVGVGEINPYEAHQIQTYTTSASSKSSYNYEKVLDLLIKMIINPKSACVFGLDYRVPVAEGIYPASFVSDIRTDSTMNEQLFAREYLSIYTAENDDSWFNFKKMNNHRKIINAEWKAQKNNNDGKLFYLISVDVGRTHDNTIVTIFKNHRRSNGTIRSTVVNIITLGRNKESKRFSRQALDLKKIIKAFNPIEVIIDTNGLGHGFGDEMIKTHYDDMGTEYPPLAFLNDEAYISYQPKDAPHILRSFKANHKINSEMFGNCYQRIDAGLVDFLIKEQDARSKLLSTKKGQKMSLSQRTRFLMPYEMTTKLFEEMGNLRLKRVGAGLDIVLEAINTRFPDDRFSSLCIGLRRIKEIEEEEMKKKRRGSGGRRLFFVSGGN